MRLSGVIGGQVRFDHFFTMKGACYLQEKRSNISLFEKRSAEVIQGHVRSSGNKLRRILYWPIRERYFNENGPKRIELYIRLK